MMNFTVAIIASSIVALISAGVGMYLLRYKAGVTEMLGMMIGMTEGMMTGIAIGYFIGAASNMFISNLVGVFIGLAFGIAFGRVGGLMGMMDGGMGGMMGGMMGAMLGVMLQYLYNGWAVPITGIFMGVIYLASIIALVRLVQHSAATAMEIDPVCGMKVDPKTALQYVYQEKGYYFCAAACKRSFSESPEMYVVKS
jgi:YHS domain-containing protein